MHKPINSEPVASEPVTPDAAASPTAAPPAVAPEIPPREIVWGELGTPEQRRLIARVREVAARLGRTTLTRDEFVRETGIPHTQIERLFGVWSEACERAGLVPARRRHAIPDATILEAMRRAFLAYGGVCPVTRIGAYLPFPVGVVTRRYGTYGAALDVFRRWAAAGATGFPYLVQIDRWLGRGSAATLPDTCVGSDPGPYSSQTPAGAQLGPHPGPRPAPGHGGIQPERVWQAGKGAVVGDTINFRGMMRAPVNEMGVVALFVLCAQDLGFEIESIGREFPDCRARRRIGPGRWQEVRIELEFVARNFEDHGHDPEGCELIICWENNWGPDCPLEVIELKEEIKKLKG